MLLINNNSSKLWQEPERVRFWRARVLAKLQVHETCHFMSQSDGRFKALRDTATVKGKRVTYHQAGDFFMDCHCQGLILKAQAFPGANSLSTLLTNTQETPRSVSSVGWKRLIPSLVCSFLTDKESLREITTLDYVMVHINDFGGPTFCSVLQYKFKTK